MLSDIYKDIFISSPYYTIYTVKIGMRIHTYSCTQISITEYKTILILYCRVSLYFRIFTHMNRKKTEGEKIFVYTNHINFF